MKLIKKIKVLLALKKALKGVEIIHKVNDKGEDKITPYVKFLSDEGIKLLHEAWELFGGGFVGDTMSGEQGHYCMLMDMPHSKWLRKNNIIETWVLEPWDSYYN